MDITFYDQHGRPFCYCEDGIHLYDFGGKPLAYFDEGSIYSFAGRHLGWVHDGWIRDGRGACLLFSESAQGGPGKPGRMGRPGKGGKAGLPGKGGRAGRPGRPGFISSWSTISASSLFS